MRWHAFQALFAAICLCGSLGSAAADTADWPQFRGSEHLGTSHESGLLDSWDEDQPRIVWRRSVGRGYSGVSAVADRLYTMDADMAHEQVLCLDAATGEMIWSVEVGEYVEAELGDGGPRSTPSVVDGLVFAVSSQSRLVAIDAGSGETVWQRDLTELGPTPRFGYASSPIVDGDLVILEVGDRDTRPGVVAFDRRTGGVRWASLEGPAGYSSALPVEIAGVRQYVLFRRAGQEAIGLSTEGEILWRFATPDALASIVMPVFVPPDGIFVSTSDDEFGGHMIRLRLEEGAFTVEVAWSERLMRNHFNTSVLVDHHLYGFDNGTLRCLDARTGERQWAKRGFGKGSLVAADGRLFVLSDGGLVALVEASPSGYSERGRRQVTEGRSWTAPSVANGRLYIRDFDELVSLDVRGDSPSRAEEDGR